MNAKRLCKHLQWISNSPLCMVYGWVCILVWLSCNIEFEKVWVSFHQFGTTSDTTPFKRQQSHESAALHLDSLALPASPKSDNHRKTTWGYMTNHIWHTQSIWHVFSGLAVFTLLTASSALAVVAAASKDLSREIWCIVQVQSLLKCVASYSVLLWCSMCCMTKRKKGFMHLQSKQLFNISMNF